jgi:AcrR family transcriptional regulator
MQDTRETIILAAIELFNEYGIQGASLSKIAQVAHMSKGTLYYYYQAKEDLVDDAFRYVQRNAKEISLKKIDYNETPEKIFKQLVRASLIWPLCFPGQLQFMENYLSLYFYKKRSYELFLFDIFTEDKITGEIREAIKPMPLDMLNFLVGSMLSNFSKYAIINPEYAKDESFLEVIAQAVWDFVAR